MFKQAPADFVGYHSTGPASMSATLTPPTVIKRLPTAYQSPQCKLSHQIKRALFSDDENSRDNNQTITKSLKRHDSQLELLSETSQSTKHHSKMVTPVGDKRATHELRSNNSRHLVRTLEDMPVFVTIEGYHVASYKVNGEPLLCLPHLLHFLQQKHSLDKVIEVFEQTVSSFTSATPKQLEGFVKAIVLPADAKSCPLIRRSDAERVCLALFNQCSKVKVLRGQFHADGCDNIKTNSVTLVGEMAAMSEQHLNHKENNNDNDESEHDDKQNSVPKRISSSDIHQSSPKNKNLSIGNTNYLNSSSRQDGTTSNSRGSDSVDRETILTHINQSDLARPKSRASSLSPALTEKDQPGDKTLEHCSSPHKDCETYRDDSRLGCETGTQLFESEAQDQILNLARAVTSTLIIQVYHRCFGKCRGLYYPSLLKDSESDCIECASCHRMFSPRRFIGHTHGSKETNVCHWGFNSYRWRSYIQLSKKQSMNNLDEDELLVQMRLLKSSFGRDDDEDDDDVENNKSPTAASDQHLSKSIDETPFENGTHLAICGPEGQLSKLDHQLHHHHQQQQQGKLARACKSLTSLHGSNSNGSLDTSSSSRLEHPDNKSINMLNQTPSTATGQTAASGSDPYSNFCDYYAALERDVHSWLLGSSHLLSLPMTSGSDATNRNHDQQTKMSSKRNTLVNMNAEASSPNCNHHHKHNQTTAVPKTHTKPTTSGSRSLLSTKATSCKRLLQNPQLDQQSLAYLSLFGAAFSQHQQIQQERNWKPAGMAALSADSSPSTVSEKLNHQDLFVSTAMESYLKSRGFHSQLTQEITDTCLDLIQKSRVLF